MRRALEIALLALLGGCWLLRPGGVAAQGADESFELRAVERVHLDDIHPGVEGEPFVELYVRALTRFGEPVEDLQPVDLLVRDAGRLIDPGDIELATLASAGRGMTCVVAIDTSRTMKGQPFERAKAAAVEFLDLLEPRDRVAIVAFSDEAELLVPFEASKAAARVELGGLQVNEASLQTALFDAVHVSVEAIRTGSDLPRRSFVILFSDGKDAGSRRSLEEVVETASPGETRPPTLLFTIGYDRFGGEGFPVLDELSRQTGGDFLRASSTIHLSSFFDQIWRQMMRSYVVRYRGRMNGELHPVEIQIDGRSDSRTVAYPTIRGPIWPYLGVVALVAGVAVIAWLLARRGVPGRLVFDTGPRAGEVVRLQAPRTRIGALADNDVVIDSQTVSRYHATIYTRGRKVEIEDLNSANGTLVNGHSIRTSPLQPGDRIRIAEVELVFER